MKPVIDLWANFLANEKLSPHSVGGEAAGELLRLAERLAEIHRPSVRPYTEKIAGRRLVVETAMDLGIDLPAMKDGRGRTAMARSLLDAWNTAYAKRFGSSFGTASAKETARRDVKTRLRRKP